MKNSIKNLYNYNKLIIHNISEENNFIFFYRYIDLKKIEIILLKKLLKKLNLDLLILQNNTKYYFYNKIINLKGQGSILLIYGNNIINIQQILNFKKLELLCILNKKNIYSIFKIKNKYIYKQSKVTLINNFQKPISYFENIIQLINK